MHIIHDVYSLFRKKMFENRNTVRRVFFILDMCILETKSKKKKDIYEILQDINKKY